jgi:hypothetical protein
MFEKKDLDKSLLTMIACHNNACQCTKAKALPTAYLSLHATLAGSLLHACISCLMLVLLMWPIVCLQWFPSPYYA